MREKRILRIIFVAVIALSIVTSCIYAEEKVDLRLKLEKGQSYKTKMAQDMKISQIIPGQQQAMTINQKTEARNIYTVEDVRADGTIVMKITYDAMLFKMESPDPRGGSNLEYDSSDTSVSSGNPIASIFGAIVGQSITIILTPDGHIKEVRGADTFFNRIKEKINELPDAQTRVGMEANLKAQYGEESLKNNMETSFNIYPDKPVGIGDTWQKRNTVSQGFPMIVNTIYTLKERKDGVATIDVFSMIQSNKEAGPMEMGPMKLQYNISGSITGLTEIQESNGREIRSTMNMKLSGNMTVENPGMKQPMSIPISMTGIITQEPY